MKIVFGLTILLLCLRSVEAQPFQMTLSTIDTNTGELAPLDSLCGGTTHPLEDGTVVELWWDRGDVGPSREDTIAPLEYINRNEFQINGFSITGDPAYRGTFANIDYFQSWGTFPSPIRFYVRVCIPEHHYYSSSMTFQPGQIRDVYLHQDDWTCLDTTCFNYCPFPNAVSSFTATDSSTCGGVALNWAWTDDSTRVDSFEIYRDTQWIRMLDASARSYIDSTALNGTRYLYSIKSHNLCGRSSREIFDFGSRYPAPQAPLGLLATRDRCGVIWVTWISSDITGIDSFYIFRGAERVGVVRNIDIPRSYSFVDTTADPDSALYTVASIDHVCGEPGSLSAGVWGLAPQIPGIVSFTVSQGLPDSTVVHWTPVPGAIRYTVYRLLADGSGAVAWNVYAPSTQYADRSGDYLMVYEYRVVAGSLCGPGESPPLQPGWRDYPSSAGVKAAKLSAEFSLQQNYPNPFNPSTQICYALPQAGHVSLTVSDVLGRRVATLVNDVQPAGRYAVNFDGKALPSGVYLYRLQVGDFVQTNKMILLK